MVKICPKRIDKGYYFIKENMTGSHSLKVNIRSKGKNQGVTKMLGASIVVQCTTTQSIIQVSL